LSGIGNSKTESGLIALDDSLFGSLGLIFAYMASKATTVQEYLDGLSPERKEALVQVRKLILENLAQDIVA